MKVVGIYKENFDDYELKRISFILEGFNKIGFDVLNLYNYDNFDYTVESDLIVGSGIRIPIKFLQNVKCKHILWRNQCVFEKFYNYNLNYLYYMSDRKFGSIYSCTPKYTDDLPSDRRLMFKLEPSIHKFKDCSTILFAHDTGYYDNDIQSKFFDYAIGYLLDNNIKFKFCMHPTTSEAGKDAIVDKYSKMGITDFSMGAFSHLNDARCVICNSGRISTDCIIKGVPVYVNDNKFTGNIIQNVDLGDFIENPSLPSLEKRIEWLNWLSYMNWTKSEYESGEAQKFLLKYWNII